MTANSLPIPRLSSLYPSLFTQLNFQKTAGIRLRRLRQHRGNCKTTEYTEYTESLNNLAVCAAATTAANTLSIQVGNGLSYHITELSGGKDDSVST